MSGVRPEDAECIQVVMPEAAHRVYANLLAMRGLVLERMPEEMQREGDLPTYSIGITDERAAELWPDAEGTRRAEGDRRD